MLDELGDESCEGLRNSYSRGAEAIAKFKDKIHEKNEVRRGS
jgi:hypothetical protein